MDQTNQTRQILMNELGLTRESVRDEMRKIIEDTAAKFINDLVASGKLQDTLVEAMNREMAKEDRWAENVKQFVKNAASRAASEFIEKHIKIGC